MSKQPKDWMLDRGEAPFAHARRFRQLPATSTPSNLALAGIIFSIPIAVIAFVCLVVAGVAVGWSLLITVALQTAAFCGIMVLGLVRGSRANAGEVPSWDVDARAGETADNWQVHTSRHDAGNPFRCSLIAPNSIGSRSVVTDLSEIGHEVHHCTDADAMIASIASRPGDWDLVIYDADVAPDPGSAVNDLLDLREARPAMPVVVISSIVSLGALSRERSVAWDVVLPKPFVRSQLLWAVETAGNEHATAAERGSSSRALDLLASRTCGAVATAQIG